MSIKELLLKFSILYAVPLIAIGFATSYFGIRTGNFFIGTALFTGCVFLACWSFGKKNRRFFTITETITATFRLAGIDFVLLLLVAWIPIALSPFPIIVSVLLFEAGLVVILHCLIMFFTAFLTKKQLLKKGLISDKELSEDEPNNLGEYLYDLQEKYSDRLSKKKKKRH